MTKRASTAAALKRACEHAGCKFIPTTPFWYMGTVDSKRCDIHILKDQKVISVKIVGFFSSNTVFRIIDEKSYGINELKKNFSDPSCELCKTKPKTPYDFKYKLPDDWKSLPKAKIILISDPFPVKLYINDEEAQIGDRCKEGELFDITSFLKLFN